MEWSMIMFCSKKKFYSQSGMEYDYVLHCEEMIFMEQSMIIMHYE